jgi:hypothetical protein
VIRRAGWAFLVATMAFLVEIIVPQFPPLRQLVVLFNKERSQHLARTLVLSGAQTVVLVAALVAVALLVARARD